jgi:hypothetical protein
MFGPWAPNGYLLASIPPLSDIYFFIHLLTMFWPWAPNVYLTSNPLFDLAASLAPHGDIPLALRPRPLTAIFLWPCGQNQFYIRLTANVDFIFSCPLTAKSTFYLPHGECHFFLTPPHGEFNFLFASRWM